MKKVRLWVCLILVVLVSTAWIYVDRAYYAGCRNITRISEDPELVQHIWKKISILLLDGEILRNASAVGGLVEVTDIKGGLGIDWDRLRISEENATISLDGKGWFILIWTLRQ